MVNSFSHFMVIVVVIYDVVIIAVVVVIVMVGLRYSFRSGYVAAEKWKTGSTIKKVMTIFQQRDNGIPKATLPFLKNVPKKCLRIIFLCF